MRALIAAVVVIAAALLSGCAGEGSPASILTGGVATDGTSTQDKSAFNPFSDELATASAQREVIQNPTLAEVLQPGALPEYSYGRADAPVVLIKYMSLTCPHCRRFHADVFPQFKRDYVDTGKVRFVLREFPIGKASGTATIALRCAPHDKGLALYGKFLEQQGQWVAQEVKTEQIARVAAQVGVSGEQFTACLADKPLASKLNTIKERGRTLGIIGTPNFFLDNRLIKTTLDWPSLKAALDQRLAAARVN